MKKSVNYMKAAYLTAKLNNNVGQENPLSPIFKEHIASLKQNKNEANKWKSFLVLQHPILYQLY